MALTPSTMLALGTAAPDFSLPDVVTGKTVSLKDSKDKAALLVMFICKHCPYVVHVQKELARLGRDYANKDVAIVAISSNFVGTHPEDSPDKLKKMAQQLGFAFPLLYDETQEVAKAYTAACTPDFFLFNANHKLTYRGQLDDSRPENGKPVTGKDLRAAMDAVVINGTVDGNQKPSMGCNIKWKPGNEPDYFG
ncbi:MAG: thioredoxin family protein [Candidatus Omnitrophica bacterium]|nr:thioredoxin family protein [Candidatus Omnitrophota bacterium]